MLERRCKVSQENATRMNAAPALEFPVPPISHATTNPRAKLMIVCIKDITGGL